MWRFLQRLIGRGEIGAGILLVLIEKQIIERTRQIVMVMHIRFRRVGAIALAQRPQQLAQHARCLDEWNSVSLLLEIEHQHVEHIDNRALLRHDAAIGEQFAQPQFGIAHEIPCDTAIRQTDRRARRARAVNFPVALVVDDRERALTNQP
jgi:hypothetical protein